MDENIDFLLAKRNKEGEITLINNEKIEGLAEIIILKQENMVIWIFRNEFPQFLEFLQRKWNEGMN